MASHEIKAPIVILRLPEVLKRVGLSRSSLYARIKEGNFPKPIKLGNTPASASGWPEDWVNEWCLQRIQGTACKTSSPSHLHP